MVAWPIYLRLAPDLRRSAYYALASGAVFAPAAFYIARFNQDASVLAAACRGGIVFLLCMTMIVPLRWCLRLDEQGIWRRRLVRWELWSWADLASGRIEKQYPCVLVDPSRPWWRRRLDPGYVDPKLLGRVRELINIYYQLPAAPQVPEVVEIKCKPFGRPRLRFDAQGVRYQRGKETRQYAWGDVVRVHITRIDPVRRDFSRLEIELPDRQIELKLLTPNGVTTPTWDGAPPAVLNELLVRNLPAERVDVDIAGERPARRIDSEKALEAARKQLREFRVFFWVMALVVAAMHIWMAVTESLWKSLWLALVSAGYIVPIRWFGYLENRSRCRKLERQLASFDTDEHGA